ncbi:ABC transporter substrate-binding protein [Desulfovibrio sulfodismutans]|uniref:ABC transporter substrate-binding protein n=1 Tax=Desulfolutivibrio sulfodismutans TaxID=63561 RepID=A0A7K3NRL4_9BACT|nr:ABC transporter substrate-binding protein [Desulfolutivibrio sulfodismutans]NDY58791.1 ABC transporter substrate-binding protein [Desulfolutivibrio sulfodismutans]QLA11862.1 ABC transporter permease [Desulfolutivibrio sulfodismutans DSM 3696]
MKRPGIACLWAFILTLAAVPALAAPYVVSISQIVEHPALDAVRNGFVEGLKKNGVEATVNVHIAQGNPAVNVQIASQMLGEKPDLVMAIATPSAQAAAQKIKDIPVLFSAVSDPVGAGLVASLDAPGGNVTGMTDMSPVDRQLELMREIKPDLHTLGVIYNAGEANSVSQLELLKAEAKKRGIDTVEATVTNSSGVFQAAKSLVGKCDAIYIPLDNTVVSALESAIKICTESKLPLFSSDNDSVPRGTIAAVAIDYGRMGEQTAVMAKRILVGGKKPAAMPVEQLQDLEVVVNKKAAADMGVTLPESVLKKADKIIE